MRFITGETFGVARPLLAALTIAALVVAPAWLAPVEDPDTLRWGAFLPGVVAAVLTFGWARSARRKALPARDLSNLVASSTMAIVAVDRAGTVRRWNPAAGEISGIPAADALGTSLAAGSLRDLVDDDDARRIEDAIRAGMAGEVTELDLTLRPGDRAERFVSAVFGPTYDERHRLVGATLFARDVTAQRRLAAAETEMEIMKRAASLREEFCAAMSHDMKTPLQSVLALAEALRAQFAGPLTDRQGGYLGHIESAADHLLALIDDVLDLTRFEAGHGMVEPVPTDLGEVVTKAAEIAGPLAEHHRISLQVDVPDGTHLVVADPRRLRQVFINLLGNAVKYTEDGGRAGISLSITETGEAVVEVWDTGLGITPENLAVLFEPFSRSDRHEDIEGTGLGLALSARLVEAHGGRITVESEPGRGSRFRVTLPYPGGEPDRPE